MMREIHVSVIIVRRVLNITRKEKKLVISNLGFVFGSRRIHCTQEHINALPLPLHLSPFLILQRLIIIDHTLS